MFNNLNFKINYENISYLMLKLMTNDKYSFVDQFQKLLQKFIDEG